MYQCNLGKFNKVWIKLNNVVIYWILKMKLGYYVYMNYIGIGIYNIFVVVYCCINIICI